MQNENYINKWFFSSHNMSTMQYIVIWRSIDACYSKWLQKLEDISFDEAEPIEKTTEKINKIN